MTEELTVERLRELLHYDLETGVFTWRIRPAYNVQIGDLAGSQDTKGYIRIQIDGKLYKAHRLAWFYVTGAWPVNQIDHRNGVRNDNRFSNIREADHYLNAQNQRRPRSDNTSGFLGVSWSKAERKWDARIMTNGKSCFLGLFDCPKAAYQKYIIAKRAQHKGNML